MMKKITFFSIILLLSRIYGFAQCVFNPTISPSNIILCPNSTDTIRTQVYDSYQWYLNGTRINGATSQYLVVDGNYSGSTVSVEVTLNGCTEMSPTILVDGWLFLLPTVMSTGNYNFDGSEFLVCTGDTIHFELLMPYNTNIQWTKNGVNITGATSNLLSLTSSVITATSDYNVCGSPDICPNFVQCLGVILPVRFINCAVGLTQNSQDNKVNIYPNPSTDIITINSNSILGETSYCIIDQLGNIVVSDKITNGLNIFSIKHLSSGTYILKLLGPTTNILKFIKE